MDGDENNVETINTGDYTPLKTEDDNIQNTGGINIVNLLYNQSKKIKGHDLYVTFSSGLGPWPDFV